MLGMWFTQRFGVAVLILGFWTAASSRAVFASAPADLAGQYFLAERILAGEGESWTRVYFREVAAKMRRTLQELHTANLEPDPTASEVHMMIGRLLLAAGDFSPAQSEFETARMLTPIQPKGAGEFSPSDQVKYRERLGRAVATAMSLDGRFREAKAKLDEIDRGSTCGSNAKCWEGNLQGCLFGLNMVPQGPAWDRSFFTYGPRDECTATWLIRMSEFLVTRSRDDLAESFLYASSFALENSRFTPKDRALELTYVSKAMLFGLLKRQGRLEEARQLIDGAMRDPRLQKLLPGFDALLKTL